LGTNCVAIGDGDGFGSLNVGKPSHLPEEISFAKITTLFSKEK
jgi:hypothetical protein